MEDQSGYVLMFHYLKYPKQSTVCYFEFETQNSTNQSRSVCFSAEKRKLIESITTNEHQNIGCKLVNFQKPDNGDLLVINFTSVKRVKLNSEKQS